jgi:hypothetical protein
MFFFGHLQPHLSRVPCLNGYQQLTYPFLCHRILSMARREPAKAYSSFAGRIILFA